MQMLNKLYLKRATTKKRNNKKKKLKMQFYGNEKRRIEQMNIN